MYLGISGWWEASLIDEAIHNRTVNLRGGLGHNIAMDRVCEFLNAEFKGTCTLHYDKLGLSAILDATHIILHVLYIILINN